MTIPIAPSHLRADADGGYSSISLHWNDNSSDETGFKIERSSDGNAYVQIGTTAAGINYYQDTGLTRGNTYYYQVRAYNATGNSAYTFPANATVFQLSDVGTPYVQLDGDTGVYSDGGVTPANDNENVQQWNDQSGNGRHVTQTTVANQPVYQTNEINSHNVLRFASGDIIVAATASDWTFLHNGSAFTTFVVWKTTNAEPDSYYVVLDTGGTTSTNTGFSIAYDDRSSQTRFHLMRVVINKGAVGNAEAELQTFQETVRGARWHVTCAHRASSSGDLKVENDGHWGGDGSAVADGSPSSSSPTYALTVGGAGNNASNLVGDIAYVLIYNSDLSDANRQRVTQWLGERFAQPEYLFFEPGKLLIDLHNAGTYDYGRFGGLTKAQDGTFVAAYGVGTAHQLDTVRYTNIILSTDNCLSWGSPNTIWDKSTDGGGTDYYNPLFLVTTSDGTIFLKCGKVVNGAVVDDGIAYFKSTNNGTSWSGPTELTGSGTDYDWAGGGPIYELANGNLLFPYRYHDVPDPSTTWTVALRQSTDGGDNWAALADIATGTEYDEPGVTQLAGGTVVGLIRDDNGQPRSIRYTTSSDNGETWAASTFGFYGYGPNVPTTTEGDDILFFSRFAIYYHARANANAAFILGDDLTTMQHGHIFEQSPNDTGAGQPMHGQFYQDIDGTLYLLYGQETTLNDSSDIMITKAVRGVIPELNLNHSPSNLASYKSGVRIVRP